MSSIYKIVKDFKQKYPGTVCWRLKNHARIIDENLFDDEVVKYAFAAQYNQSHGKLFDTAIIAITDKRIMIAQDYVLVGYELNSITPDLYNDMQIHSGLLWGMVTIDTVKETIHFTNISKKALPEIQKNITSNMMEAKAKFNGENKEFL